MRSDAGEGTVPRRTSDSNPVDHDLGLAGDTGESGRAVVHRVRNQVATILSSTEWALTGLAADSPVRGSLEVILASCHELVGLIGTLATEGSPASQTLLDCIPRVRAELPESLTLELGAIPPLVLTESDFHAASLVLLYFAKQAAMRMGGLPGSVRICTAAEEGPPGQGNAPAPAHGSADMRRLQVEIRIAMRGGEWEALDRRAKQSALAPAIEVARSFGCAAALESPEDPGVRVRVRLPILHQRTA